MRRELRVGVSGAGLMGQWHAHAARQAGAVVAAFADPDISAAQSSAQKYRAAALDDTAELLATSDIAVLHVCSPTQTHSDVSALAMGQGTHVFIEKPVAQDQAQTWKVLQAAKQAKVQVCPAHQYAFQRSVERIRDNLHKLNEITAIDLRFFSAGGLRTDTNALIQIAADILPHPVSILQRLLPDRQIADLDWKLHSARPGEWMLVSSVDGIVLKISVGLLSRPTCVELTVVGTGGSFEADLFHDYATWQNGMVSRTTKMTRPFTRSAGHFFSATGNLLARAVRKEPAYPGLRALVSQFYDACEQQTACPISDVNMMDVARFRDGFLQAAQAGGDVLDMQPSLYSDL